MAALTQSSIDALLGLLTTAIKDEAQLIGGVHSDMKFIKDEMDSMNGFLLHLTKIESEHDDQVRAWMKQVREVSYVAEDCVDRYVRIGRHGVRLGDGWCAGLLAMARLLLLHPRAYFQLQKLTGQIAELKARVHDVGERRQRYDVSVPDGRDLRRVDNKLPGQEEEERRDAFVRALEEKLDEERKQASAPAAAPLASLRRKMGGMLQDALAVPSAALGVLGLGGVGGGDIIGQLPALLVPSEAATIRGILKKCGSDHPASGGGGGGASSSAEAPEPDETEAFRCTKKMFLCALYVYPYPTSQELKKLKAGVEAPGVAAKEARDQVMVFCYSLLSTQQKSSLQYLTAFLHEKEISRTSMVRRWVAEGLVGKQPGGGVGRTTPEEAGERCFRELLHRGFVRPARRSDTGSVKSCVMDDPVRDFIVGITKSENFVDDLPAHLERQLRIRGIVNRRRLSSMSPPPPPLLLRRCFDLRLRCCLDDHDALGEDNTTKDPMDELVDFLRELPELYRLNVLDLGGCTGLKRRHLRSFGEVECLRYLSLRNTDVLRLHAHHIKELTLLETLDIRGTNIPPRDTKKLYLPKLKHLLAGRFTTMPAASDGADASRRPRTPSTTTTEKAPAKKKKQASLVTVHIPRKIGSMGDMETLCHVQVSSDGAELRGVARLRKLRKLGVVVHANASTAELLGRALYMLAGTLRSLSICVAAVPHTVTSSIQQGPGGGGSGGVLDISYMHEIASGLVLENLDIKGKMSLPSWVGRAPKLANVTLGDTEMDGRDALRRLSAVQGLRCLKLSRKAFTEQALRFKDVQFRALKFLVVEGDAITQIAFFADDAAPKLERIVWEIDQGSSRIAQMYNEDLIVGINHLPSLKVIEIRASFKHNTNPLEWTQQQTAASSSSTRVTKTRYCIRYINLSSDQDPLIAEVPRSATIHTTFSLPAGVIN